MTTGPYRVDEVEDAGTAACSCDNCGWTGTADLTVDVGDCSLTPGDASPVGRCPECDGLVYLEEPLHGQTIDQRLLDMVNELDAYLREIRAENLDGSEPALGDLLERSLDLRLKLQPETEPASPKKCTIADCGSEPCGGCYEPKP